MRERLSSCVNCECSQCDAARQIERLEQALGEPEFAKSVEALSSVLKHANSQGVKLSLEQAYEMAQGQ